METKYSILTKLLKNLKTSVLPSGTAANAGKVATIGETGEWEAATPSGGSGGGVLVVHDENGTLDKTWQDIWDSMTSRGAVLVSEEHFTAYRIDSVRVDSFTNKYMVSVGLSGMYACTTPDGYPEYQDQNPS